MCFNSLSSRLMGADGVAQYADTGHLGFDEVDEEEHDEDDDELADDDELPEDLDDEL